MLLESGRRPPRRLPVSGYDWAPYEVGLYAPYYVTNASLEYLASRVDIVSSAKDANDILLTVCWSKEHACHGCKGHNIDLFYIYTTLFLYASVCRGLHRPSFGT
ncbi:hypothetical protein V8G54_022575 [Vigna mungo]|uniref:Uncharacterized protein n=1 Tax=Vigna mungo TaxID=3915 RepID=A0AAQ3N2R8_VIGMU